MRLLQTQASKPASDRPSRLWTSVTNSQWLLLVPALLLLVPIYVVPVGGLLLTSFGMHDWTLTNYREAFGNEAYLKILYRTVILSLEVTSITILLGYPLAYMVATAPEERQKWLLALLAMPLWTSALVRSFAWIVLLGRQGIVNKVVIAIGLQDQPIQLLYGRASVLIGFVHVMLPYTVFPLVSVMRRIPVGLSFTGVSLGANRPASFWLIFFPLSLPGVVSGLVLTFVLSMGYFVTPALLGGLRETTYVMLIQQQVEQAVNWPLASAMAVILLAVTLTVVAIFYRFIRLQDEPLRADLYSRSAAWLLPLVTILVGKYNALLLRRSAHSRTGHQDKAQQARRILIPAVGWTIIAFIVIPILILFPLSMSGAAFLEFPPSSFSLRWYSNYFLRPDWVAATLRSFVVALPVMVITTAIGSAAAIANNRGRGRAVWSIRGLVISPLIIPHILIGIAIYFTFARLKLIGSTPALVVAHCVIALPIVTVIVESALRRANIGPERAALSLGAGPVRAFMSTTFVAIRPSIITAALFAFLTSFDDLVVALFIAGTSGTLPKRMWEGVSFEIDPTISAASTLLVLLSLAIVLAVDLIGRRVRRGETTELPAPS